MGLRYRFTPARVDGQAVGNTIVFRAPLKIYYATNLLCWAVLANSPIALICLVCCALSALQLIVIFRCALYYPLCA